MKLYCDMDGVLADFEAGYRIQFPDAPPASKATDNVDWDLVRTVPDFYENLPPMVDAHELWDYIRLHAPTVLTGVPQRLIGDANTQKHRWIHRRWGEDVPVITCRSKEKCLHCQPGDILIDDWEKYRHLWEAAGGIWITHIDAESTIQKLEKLGL
jgi:hypothetical protein